MSAKDIKSEIGDLPREPEMNNSDFFIRVTARRKSHPKWWSLVCIPKMVAFPALCIVFFSYGQIQVSSSDKVRPWLGMTSNSFPLIKYGYLSSVAHW